MFVDNSGQAVIMIVKNIIQSAQDPKILNIGQANESQMHYKNKLQETLTYKGNKQNQKVIHLIR